MIAYLKGKLIELDINKLIILTNSGIGYEVGISEITYSKLYLNKQAELYIYHHITDNSQSLFGFLDIVEKEVFEELIKISGIGGKVAIQILGLGVEKLSNSIRNKDRKVIESIKGIGKKMAEKIILELKDKNFILENIGNINISDNKEANIPKINRNLKKDIIMTLTNMGYQKSAIEIALTKIPKNLESTQDIIGALIKEL